MKSYRNRLIRSLVAAAVVASAAVPVAQAGHKEFGARCALALSQHRPDAVTVCARAAKALRDDRRDALTPSVATETPSGFDWSDAGVGAAGLCGLIALSGAVIASRYGARRSV